MLFTLLLWITTTVTATAAEVETLTFFHHDASGSVVAATNDAGEEIWRKNYRPYGEQQAGSNTSEPVSYTGHTHDNALGLTYMKNRYYDPHAGRFMGIDPVQVEDSVESNPQMFNRYAYGNNNPYRYVDPDGGNPKLIADFALNVALNYATTGSLGLSSALVETAKGAFNPLATVSKVNKLAKAIQQVNKKIAAAKPAGKIPKKADFIVDKNGTAVRNSASGARKDLGAGGFPGTKTTETFENGTIHRRVPGKDGPMDVRIMDGQSNGNAFKGPRIRTTRSGSANDGVRSDGSRFRNNESKSERLRDSHIHF